jgi:hypothetical protein
MTIERVSTGISALDALIEGGIPRGFTVLVAGNPGTGKTVLTTHFLYDGLLKGEAALYVSFSESRNQFYENFDRFGMTFSDFDHFLIHCIKFITDSTNSCPLVVSLYSTRGGISLYANLSNILLSSNSFNLRASVLLLNPFSNFLNSLYLTGCVEQQRGINISIVPLLVINFRILAVSFINMVALYPSKLHSFLYIGSWFTPCPLVSDMSPSLLKYSQQFK